MCHCNVFWCSLNVFWSELTVFWYAYTVPWCVFSMFLKRLYFYVKLHVLQGTWSHLTLLIQTFISGEFSIFLSSRIIYFTGFMSSSGLTSSFIPYLLRTNPINTASFMSSSGSTSSFIPYLLQTNPINNQLIFFNFRWEVSKLDVYSSEQRCYWSNDS